MKFREYEDVRLNTDKYEKDGFMKGMIGTIVDVYDDGAAYEVDFTSLEVDNYNLIFSFTEDELDAVPDAYGDGKQDVLCADAVLLAKEGKP